MKNDIALSIGVGLYELRFDFLMVIGGSKCDINLKLINSKYVFKNFR